MTEQEKLMYEILQQISSANVPIVFKGGLIANLILNESGLNSVQRQTYDIDANWVGSPPTMDLLVKSLNDSFGNLQKSYYAAAFREYGNGKSAGIAIISQDTKEQIITMDIDVKPLIGSKYYVYEQGKIRGVLPTEILADKISVLSTDKIYKWRAKDILDTYLLSQCVDVYSKDIFDICEKANRSISAFDAFLNKKPETEYAYNKLRGIENKPDFSVVYEYLSKFIEPFLSENRGNKRWNCHAQTWQDVEKTRYTAPLNRKQLLNNAKIIAEKSARQSNAPKKNHDLE